PWTGRTSQGCSRCCSSRASDHDDPPVRVDDQVAGVGPPDLDGLAVLRLVGAVAHWGSPVSLPSRGARFGTGRVLGGGFAHRDDETAPTPLGSRGRPGAQLRPSRFNSGRTAIVIGIPP